MATLYLLHDPRPSLHSRRAAAAEPGYMQLLANWGLSLAGACSLVDSDERDDRLGPAEAGQSAAHSDPRR